MDNGTVRKLVDDYRNRIKDSPDMHGMEVTEIMMQLSALMGNVTAVIEQRAYERQLKLVALLEQPKMTVSKASALIEVTPEHRAWRQAQNLLEEVKTMIGTLKYRCRALEEEKIASFNT